MLSGNDGLDVNALNNLGYFVGPCGSKLPNVLCVGGVSGAPNQNAMVRLLKVRLDEHSKDMARIGMKRR